MGSLQGLGGLVVGDLWWVGGRPGTSWAPTKLNLLSTPSGGPEPGRGHYCFCLNISGIGWFTMTPPIPLNRA